jgi:cupin fold WbuC family metalloprotein
MNYNFHEHEDPVNRLLNAIEPTSYICPHRHLDPPQEEAFLVLRGSGALILFQEEGAIEEIVPLDGRRQSWGVDIPAGWYHSIVARESGSVFYEVKRGPYDPSVKKDFAPWAPAESSPEAREYLAWLQSEVDERW